MKKAFAYLRASAKGRFGRHGFLRQLEAIRAFGKQRGIKIVAVFREEVVRGAKPPGNRPEFLKMVAALHADGVRLVLVEKLNRLAPGIVAQELLMRDLRKQGFELISVAEPQMSQDGPSSPTRKLIRQIMGAIADHEKSMIVLRLRVARLRAKTKTGRCEGAKPYGTLPSERDVVERMKALRASGMSFDRIAERLNAGGVKPRRGVKWYGITINKILSRGLNGNG